MRNHTERDVRETAQCYVIPPRNSEDAPQATLVGFAKPAIPAGGSAEVEFRLDDRAFMLVDAAGRQFLPSGTYTIVVGAASPGPRAIALGAPAPVSTQVVVP
jgi:beta-glucosidase